MSIPFRPSYLLPASSALTRRRGGWLESGSGVGEVAVGLGFVYFEQARVPPACPSDERVPG